MAEKSKITDVCENNSVDVQLHENQTSCDNCESKHHVSYEFCPFCGQNTNDKLTVGLLFYNTIANYFSFDARFFRSFFPLIFNPGLLAKRFVKGKRLLYLHPAQMYLFISVLFFFLFSFKVKKYDSNLNSVIRNFDMNMMIDSTQLDLADSLALIKMDQLRKIDNQQLTINNLSLITKDSVGEARAQLKNELASLNFMKQFKKLDSLISVNASEKDQLGIFGVTENTNYFKKKIYTQSLKLYRNKGSGLFGALFDSIPLSLFLILPIFAVILKILFFKRRLFAHHLVFSFYFFSFIFAFMCMLLLVNYAIDLTSWMIFFAVLITFIYFVVALRTFYEQRLMTSLFKASVMTTICMMLIVPVAFMIVGLMFVSY